MTGQSFDGEKCADCSVAPVFLGFAVLVTVLAVFVVQLKSLGNVSVRARLGWMSSMQQSLGLVLTTAQTLSLLGQLGLLGQNAQRDELPDMHPGSGQFQEALDGTGNRQSPKSAFGEALLDMLVLKPSMLQPECFVGYDPVAHYGFSVGMLFFFAFLFVCFAAVVKILRRQSDGAHLIRVGLSIIRLAFIPIVLNSALVLQAYSHPGDSNGSSSLTDYPSVLVGSEEHYYLLTLSAAVLCLMVLPFLSVCLLGAMWGPQSLGKARFEQVFLFMLQRFRPRVWWFEIGQILCNLVLAFAPLISADDPQGQCLFLLAISVINLACLCTLRPWKSKELNLLNISILIMLIFVLITRLASLPTSLHIKMYEQSMTMVLWSLVSLIMLGCVLISSAPMISKATHRFRHRSSYFQQVDSLALAGACLRVAKPGADKEHLNTLLEHLDYFEVVQWLRVLTLMNNITDAGATPTPEPDEDYNSQLESSFAAAKDLEQELDENELLDFTV